jgi:hypothetical protein
VCLDEESEKWGATLVAYGYPLQVGLFADERGATRSCQILAAALWGREGAALALAGAPPAGRGGRSASEGEEDAAAEAPAWVTVADGVLTTVAGRVREAYAAVFERAQRWVRQQHEALGQGAGRAPPAAGADAGADADTGAGAGAGAPPPVRGRRRRKEAGGGGAAANGAAPARRAPSKGGPPARGGPGGFAGPRKLARRVGEGAASPAGTQPSVDLTLDDEGQCGAAGTAGAGRCARLDDQGRAGGDGAAAQAAESTGGERDVIEILDSD